MKIQLVKNCAAAGVYLLLRVLLQNAPEQTKRSIIRVRKLRILLSLLAIPTMTLLYVDDIMVHLQYYPAIMPPLPVSVYIACLALLVFDVLREYNALVKVKRRTNEEEPVESS